MSSECAIQGPRGVHGTKAAAVALVSACLFKEKPEEQKSGTPLLAGGAAVLWGLGPPAQSLSAAPGWCASSQGGR